MIDSDALAAALLDLNSDECADPEALVVAYLARAGFAWESTNVVSDTERLKRRLVGPWQPTPSDTADALEKPSVARG